MPNRVLVSNSPTAFLCSFGPHGEFTIGTVQPEAQAQRDTVFAIVVRNEEKAGPALEHLRRGHLKEGTPDVLLGMATHRVIVVSMAGIARFAGVPSDALLPKYITKHDVIGLMSELPGARPVKAKDSPRAEDVVDDIKPPVTPDAPAKPESPSLPGSKKGREKANA